MMMEAKEARRLYAEMLEDGFSKEDLIDLYLNLLGVPRIVYEMTKSVEGL